MQSTLSGSAALLTTQQAALLGACTSFRTLDEHAAANAVSRAELDSLVDMGLLTSDQELRLRCLRASRPGGREAAISTVAVITRDRIDTLRRCLESFIAEGQRLGRGLDYLVIDTAQKGETREMTRAALRTVARTHAVTLRYAGLEERRRFADGLHLAGLPRSAIDFALFDPEGCDATYGAARNAVLLGTLGRLVLCADDDTVCKVAAVPDSSTHGLAFSSQNDPTAIWFYRDNAEALASAEYADRDIFGAHEELLGRDVASCIEFATGIDLLDVKEMDGALMRVVDSGRGRVAITSTGVHGDAGSGMPPAIRLLDEASRARLTQSEETYRTLAQSRNVQRGVSVRTISNGPYLMTIGAGFDNRAIMPPFFPVLRGEDTIYGFMLGLCQEGACIGHLPFTVLHSPAEVRNVAPDAINQFAAHPTTFELVIACIQSYSPPPGADAPDRLSGLGRHLGELSSLAPADFEEFLLLSACRMKALAMAHLTHELEGSNTPSASWATDVRDYLDRLRASLATEGYLMTPDLTTRSGADALRVLQRLLARFAELLECWPAMLVAARSLAANGHDLAPPLNTP